MSQTVQALASDTRSVKQWGGQHYPHSFHPGVSPTTRLHQVAHLRRRSSQSVGFPGTSLAKSEDGAGETVGNKGVAGPGLQVSGQCKTPSPAQPTHHSPTQRQLAQALHTASSEHVLLCARPVQYGTEAERHVGAPTRRAHLERGWSRGKAPCRARDPGQEGPFSGEWGTLKKGLLE